MTKIVELARHRNAQEATVLTGWSLFRMRWREFWKYRVRRKLPYLVWWGERIYVRVQLTEFGLGGDLSSAFRAEDDLHKLKINFDTGIGINGRDWEWDWSLEGPISVTFRGKP